MIYIYRTRGVFACCHGCLVQYISYRVELLVCTAMAEKDDYIID
jgi:hypothetical protein